MMKRPACCIEGPACIDMGMGIAAEFKEELIIVGNLFDLIK